MIGDSKWTSKPMTTTQHIRSAARLARLRSGHPIELLLHGKLLRIKEITEDGGAILQDGNFEVYAWRGSWEPVGN